MPERMPCIVRVDGDPHLGLGHVIRCLTLADELKRQGARIIFLIREADGVGRSLIERHEYEIRGIPTAASLSEDLEFLCATIRSVQAQCGEASMVLLDGYAFSADYQRGVLSTGATLTYVDDLARGPQVARLVLNQNIWARPDCYADLAPHSRLLLGPHYALVRREFTEAARLRASPEPRVVRQVLVTLGGADGENVTGRVAKWLSELHVPARCVLLVGPGYPYLRELRTWVQQRPERFTLVSAPEDVAALMAQMDVAISNAGSTCWELCCLGVPTFVIILADNQVRIAEGLSAAGIFENLGWFTALTAERLGRRVNALLENQAQRDTMSGLARRLVDGLGAQRVASAMVESLQAAATPVTGAAP